MQEISLSLNNNVLKLTVLHKGAYKKISAHVPSDICEGSKILDQDGFNKLLNDHLNELVTTRSNCSLTYIVEPQNIFLGFVVVSKTDGDNDTQVISQVKQRLGDDTDKFYLVYQKIAPFIYQYIGIDRDFVEQIMQAATYCQLSLTSIVPWVLLLPKYNQTSAPVIYITKNDGLYVVALSELSGVFFTSVYNKQKSLDEIQSIVKDLSFYKRPRNPINRVYTFNYPEFSDVSKEFSVESISVPGVEEQEMQEYETHLFVRYMINTQPDTMASYINLLNIVPLPVVVKSRPLVYVGAAMVMLLFIAGGGFIYLNRYSEGEKAVVLSESTMEPAPIAPVVEPIKEPVMPNVEKKDITLRVENGAGIAGIAGKTQTLLESMGYKVASIGNSEQTEIEKTRLIYKKSKVAYKDLLINDLSSKFDLEVSDTLDETLEYDVLVIVGTQASL